VHMDHLDRRLAEVGRTDQVEQAAMKEGKQKVRYLHLLACSRATYSTSHRQLKFNQWIVLILSIK
jgi:hypothetical protein